MAWLFSTSEKAMSYAISKSNSNPEVVAVDEHKLKRILKDWLSISIDDLPTDRNQFMFSNCIDGDRVTIRISRYTDGEIVLQGKINMNLGGFEKDHCIMLPDIQAYRIMRVLVAQEKYNLIRNTYKLCTPKGSRT